MDHLLSTADAAQMLGIERWQVARLFESGAIAEPPRFGGKRIVSRQLLRKIREAAIERGWLRDETAARGAVVDPENADRPRRGPPLGPRRKKVDAA